MLTLYDWCFEKYNTRSNTDRCKKVDRYVVSYRDENGVEYGRSFEFKPGTAFEKVEKNVPKELES